MSLVKLLTVFILVNVLSACATTDGPAVAPHQPLATGGQDAATFAAKTY